MLEIIKLYYTFHAWAMTRLLEAMKQLSSEEYKNTEASGHGSIRDTFAHLLRAEWGWFSWFDKSMTPEQVYQLTLRGEEIDTVDEAGRRWAKIHQQEQSVIAGLTEPALKEDWSFKLPNGVSGSLPLWKMMLHVANHGTHHTAQIMAAIRRAGHNPGGGDLIQYLLQAE